MSPPVSPPLMSEIEGAPRVDRPTIWAGFQAAVASSPTALALACAHQPAALFSLSGGAAQQQHPYLRWTFAELHEGVHRVVAAWRALGVREGSMLVTFAQNSAEWTLALWAAIKMGCVIMPVSPRNLTNADEIAHMVKTGLVVAGEAKAVVLAGTMELARIVDSLDLFPGALMVVLEDPTQTADTHWMPFERLMRPGNDYSAHDVDEAKAVPASGEGGCVLFTSGTTSLPKGVYMSHERNFSRSSYGLAGIKQGSSIVLVMPNNHGMGCLMLIMGLMSGAAIVLPGAAFEPVSMLETMYAEKATHTILVPTMIYALAAAKAASAQYANRPLSNLENVLMGGAGVTAEHLRMVIEELGALAVENFYGSTEGLLLYSGRTRASEINSIVDGDNVTAGRPPAGYRAKIVDPETGKTVPRNTLGEIQGFGWCMSEPYIGGVGKDSWYSDERPAVVQVRRPRIIRGGENISPNAMEAILSKHHLLKPLMPQIVGTKDTIAGEVPVAVVLGEVTAEIRETIQSQIVQHMGALYVPEDVLSVKDLGLDDYPRTTSGKIQKTRIRSLVDEYMSKPATTDVDLVQDIKTIWARAVGLDPLQIRLDAPFKEFADSITIMRVREKIKKHTGKTLSLAAMAEAGTIEQQIKLLQSMEVPPKAVQRIRVDRPRREGGPKVEDMAHLTEDPDLFEPTKALVVRTISSDGLGWDDVEDVIPAYDFVAMMSQTRMFESWTWEFALQPTVKLDKTQLRRASEAAITNNRILASYLMWDSDTLGSDVALHVVMKQSSKFFDLIFEDGGELETIEDLKQIPEHHPHPDWVKFPGPMFRFILYDIKETGRAATVVSMNHAVADATMMQLLQEDLDRAFALAAASSTSAEIVSQLPAHVDFKVWADSYHNLRTSSEARAATKWHVKRLKSIADHVRDGDLLPCKPRASRGPDPTRFSFEVPDIHQLRKEHPHITPTILMKAAVALVDVERTGYTHAVMVNLEAARTHFPFLTKSMLEQPSVGTNLEATDVSGPTFQMVFNVVEIDGNSGETVLEFLERMQEDQAGLTKHASAPLMEIMKELDKIRPGAGGVLPRLVQTPHFNWPPGLGQTGTNPYPNLKMENGVNRPTTGPTYHAGLGGEKNQTLFLNVYGSGPDDEDEAALLGKKTVAIAKWLVTRQNWNVPVVEFPSSLNNM